MTPREAKVDIARLRSTLQYDPYTGIITRSGRQVGRLCKDGYMQVSFANLRFMSHRIGWAIHFGVFPIEQLDHINRIRNDNRLVNLRECSNRSNSANKGRALHLVGTTYLPSVQKWQAQAKIGGRNRYLGLFESQSEAREAYLSALTHYKELAGTSNEVAK